MPSMLLKGMAPMPVGLDISTDVLRVAQLRPAPQKPFLINYGSIRAPTGSVKDGEISDIDMVSSSLRKLWKDTGITERRVVLGVSNQKVIVRLITLPYLEKRDLKGALKFQAQDYIPIPVEEAVLDFEVVGEYVTEKNERMLEILLVAAQKEMINKYIAAAERAKLRPYIVDVSAFALIRSLLKRPSLIPTEEETKAANGAMGLIDIGKDITNIVLIEGGIPRFTRVTSTGEDSFTETLASFLRVAYDEAEEIKNLVGMPPPEGDRLKGIPKEIAEEASFVQEVLEEEGMRFIGELRKSFDYGLTQVLKTDSVKKMILSGSGVTLPNLQGQIEKNFQIKADLGHPLKEIQIGPKLSPEELSKEELSLAICLGLAMRGLD